MFCTFAIKNNNKQVKLFTICVCCEHIRLFVYLG